MKVLFRTEANHKQGMGDLLGCLAIAESICSHNGNVCFLTRDYPEAHRLLAQSSYPFITLPIRSTVRHDLRATLAAKADVVVINKLRSSIGYVRGLRDAYQRVVTIDDDGEGARWAHERINPLYPVSKSLSSFRYIMLRSVFNDLRHCSRRVRNHVESILVMQGGADTNGFLPKIVRALGRVRADFRATVVVGPAFRHQQKLREAVKSSKRNIEILQSPTDLPRRMLEADMAITAGGLTMFELACVGTPSLVLCAEPFEVATAKRFARRGAIRNLGFGRTVSIQSIAKAVTRLAVSPQDRARMSRIGKRAIDGLGADRIARHIISLAKRKI